MAGTSFPLWRTVAVGYRSTFENIGTVFHLAWLPLAIVILVNIDPTSFWKEESEILKAIWRDHGGVIRYALFFVVNLCFAVFGLRVFDWKLRAGEQRALSPLRIGRREITFLSLVAAYFIIDEILWEVIWRLLEQSGLDKYVTTGIFPLLALMVFLIELLLVSRLIFTLPIAVVEGENLSDTAWILGRGVWWRLVFLLLLTFGSFALIKEVLLLVAAYSPVVFGWYLHPNKETLFLLLDTIYPVLQSAVKMLGIAVTVAAISEAYRIRTSDLRGQNAVSTVLTGTRT